MKRQLRFIRLLLPCVLAGSVRAATNQLPALPPDLPLPAAPPMRDSWLWGANILQPYGHSEYVALVNVGDRPRRLKSELGFNTVVVQPPESHNSINEPKLHVTDAQFREAVTAYHAAGYHVILYTSVMGDGMNPEFQSGRLTQKHPDWEQRDPKGNPVMVYGAPWLCPSSPAREYTLDHALRVVREFHPDGILLDNNEFFHADAGWTCHCEYCTRAFREYARHRLGPALTQQLFGVPPEKLEIPSTEGPLFSLWLHWRNRVWAGINESFRDQLRKINPHAILFANTQYLWDDGMLGTDLQYKREDILISESCNLSSRKMSEKMLLGGALAEGRPLWNYIGTFVNNEDYTGLKPVGVVGPLIAATLAHGARPWIVDGFDEGQTDAQSRHEMAALLGWHAARPDLFAGEPWTPVGVVFSLDSRNILHRPLIPPHLKYLLKSGVPVAGLRDDEITAKSLRRFRVLTIETAGCLGEPASHAIAKWVRNGGALIAAGDVGCYDELGRKRPESVLWNALGLGYAPHSETIFGRGKVIAPAATAFAQQSVNYINPEAFKFSGASGLEVVPYCDRKTLLLQIVRHETPTQPVIIHLPASFKPATAMAQWLSPEQNAPEALTIDGNTITITNCPLYSVVRVSIR
jgi:hypothetical protein